MNIDENSLIFVSSHTIRDYDYNPGIFDKQYPLIYLQLEAANTILKGKFITEYSLFEKVLLRLILILVLWIISLKTHNHIFIIFSLVSGFLYIVFTVLGFFYLNRLSYILNPSIGFLLSIIVLFIYRTLNQVTMMRRQQQTQKEKLIHTNKMVTLGTMVSSIAHDVNNPNNVIKMEAGFISKNFLYFKEVLDKVSEEHLSLLLNEISYPELKNDFIQSIMGIQKSSQKIEEIVHELKNFYKKASPDRKEPVDLIEVINSSVFLLSHEINKTAIIHFAFPSNKLPMITGNPQRLEQVFINIIQNSCNAIKEKNQILETHIKRDISISVVSDNLKNLIRICLEDQGCGIDGKIIDRVTEPFFSTRLDRGGSGLGLYIVKSIINAHNGEIKLFSKEGEGTKIIISLPYQS